MSRPKPSVLLEHTNKQTYRCEQVLESDAIWAVFYQSKPFNLKSFNSKIDNAGPKYKKTSFSNPGHAINLAERLNELYNCTDFTVYKMTDGVRIA